ncbi:MAG TPA: NUDIX domain-containing protein [Edaphobacter sp.]
MPKRSAGLLMYRRRSQQIEVFLVHPGGPLWAKKNLGAWTIPKGEYDESEQPLAAAIREFHEETGITPSDNFIDLGTIRQSGGKLVSAWAFEGDCDPAQLTSNLCQLKWPPHSGRLIQFPEVDRGAWFSLSEAAERILKSQQPLLEILINKLKSTNGEGT